MNAPIPLDTEATDYKLSAGPIPSFYNPDSYVAAGGSVGHIMSHVVTALSQELDRQFEPSGLTNAQWKPLFKLSQLQASTVAELARECLLDAGGMTRLLDRLEAKGLCLRERSSEDRRVVNLALTDAGREAAEVIPVVLSRTQNAFLAGFKQEEWEQLQGYLRRMLINAREIQAQVAKEKNDQ